MTNENNYHEGVKFEFHKQNTLNNVNRFEKNGEILIAVPVNVFEDILNIFLFTLQQQVFQYYNDENLFIWRIQNGSKRKN